MQVIQQWYESNQFYYWVLKTLKINNKLLKMRKSVSFLIYFQKLLSFTNTIIDANNVEI